MADISCDIVVVGAGVLGLCVAGELASRGRDVRVIDPGEPNASSVAAGMIAPAAEILLDRPGGDVATLFREAAALWPDLAAYRGILLDPTPAEWAGEHRQAAAALLADHGFETVWEAGRLHLPSDVRLDPGQALAALARSIETPVLPQRLLRMARTAAGWRLQVEDGSIESDAVVLANGTAGPVPGLPGAVVEILARVSPIAGQIGRVARPLTDRVVRGDGAYVVPGAGGSTLIGATMVEGERHPVPDRAASQTLVRAAEALLGRPIGDAVEWRVGVRGASPDGLPMAGPTREPAIHVALAPRRNGWLLGPMVAKVVADGIEGRPRDRYAAAFDPLRFSSQAG